MSRIPLITLGTGGAIVLGVCLYFDWKRRSDPNYKKKVHERRQKMQGSNANNSETESEMAAKQSDQEKVQQYFHNHVKMAEQLFRQSRVDEGLVHLANAIRVCAEPVALLDSMKLTLPEPIFNMLLTKIPELTQMTSRMAWDVPISSIIGSD